MSVSKQQIIVITVTLAVALIVITPLCGWIFYCGCTWPGLGLDSGCNFYSNMVLHKCPWCVSLKSGVFAVLLSVFAGLTAAFKWGGGKAGIGEICRGIVVGLTVFFCTAVIWGWVTALLQGYSLYWTVFLDATINYVF